MASISITVPDVNLTAALNAACAFKGYAATINGAPNPETKPQFIKRMLAVELKSWVIGGARQEAAATGQASVDSISIT